MFNTVRTIVVFESRPRWEPELQRQFLDEPARVRGCRSWIELSSLASDVVVIDLSDDATACLQWLGNTTTRARTPSVIVLCPVESAELEWPLRDAGVLQVLVGEFSGQRLARSCQRLWSARSSHSAQGYLDGRARDP